MTKLNQKETALTLEAVSHAASNCMPSNENDVAKIEALKSLEFRLKEQVEGSIVTLIHSAQTSDLIFHYLGLVELHEPNEKTQAIVRLADQLGMTVEEVTKEYESCL